MTTPFLDALKNSGNSPQAAFYVPGHKQGKGISPQLSELFGESVFRYDLPELPEFGSLFPPDGAMKTAQDLAANAFGAEKTWFLANGSTSGVMAAILATCGDGDKIILPRNVHQSAIAALIFSGAIPIFINPIYDPQFDLPYSITPKALEETLSQHQDAKAVFLVSPTYQGICADIPALSAITHAYDLPLIVDAAHGAHFGFHPQLPASPLTQGADVVIQSVHKTLGALTQASLLHLQGEKVNSTRLATALQCLQSSSPSHLLFASLDAAREQVATQGKDLFDYTLDLVARGKAGIEENSKITLLNPSLPQAGCYDLDATRITINLEQLGLTGFAADEILHQELGVTAELPTAKTLTFVVTFGNTNTDIDTLITGLNQLRQYQPQTSLVPPQLSGLPPLADCFSPRKAFFSAKQTLPLAEAVGEISTEFVCPYPPGIPVLIPGEKITPETLDYLQQIFQLSRNITITGCSDATLKTLQVIAK